MKDAANHSNESHQSKSNAHPVAQKPTSQEASFEPPGAFTFEDKRAATVAQRKLQVLTNNSPQVQRLRAIQKMANKSLQAQKATPLHGRTIQRRVNLEMIGKTIEGASAEDILEWLGRYDREYKTLYRSEAEDLGVELNQLVSDTVDTTYGFLQGPALVQKLRAMSGRTGPKPETAASHVLFGLDGKDLQAIKSALKLGYRQFDTAETYGNIELLATAIEDTGLPRASFHIVYKIEAKQTKEKALMTLMSAVSRFEYFDSVLIHNAREPETAILKTWEALQDLKSSGKAKKIGIGNFGLAEAEMLKKLGPVDVVELEAFEVLVSKELVKLVTSMGGGVGVDVLYYQIVQMAKAAGMDTAAESLAALIETVDAIVGNGFPILSSGSRENQKKNLKAASDKIDTDYDEMEKLNKTIQEGRTCTVNGPEVAMTPQARNALSDLVDNADSYRKKWKRKDLRKAIRKDLPDFEPVLNIKIPERKGLKRVYVGRSGESVVRALLGPSSCDHKWSIELLQLLLMSREKWNEVGSLLSNIV